MAQIRLVQVVGNVRPPSSDWDEAKSCRPQLGYTIQAAPSQHHRACRFCGEPTKGHHPRFCDAPVRRGWGWPGWERSISLDTLRSIGRPSRAKQAAIATFAAFRSRTGTNKPKSTLSKRKRLRTSGGTPENPQ